MSAPHVILVGQMGAGKSTVAHALAALWPTHHACDLDHAIEATGRSVSEIFASEGEAAFRALEADTLARLLAGDRPLILATGGGAPCQPGAMDRLRAAGVTLWLAAAPAILAQRLAHETHQRPLLQSLAGTSLEAFLDDQLATRRAHYERAHLTVDASLPPDLVASTIDQLLRGLLGDRS